MSLVPILSILELQGRVLALQAAARKAIKLLTSHIGDDVVDGVRDLLKEALHPKSTGKDEIDRVEALEAENAFLRLHIESLLVFVAQNPKCATASLRKEITNGAGLIKKTPNDLYIRIKNLEQIALAGMELDGAMVSALLKLGGLRRALEDATQG